MVETTIGQGRIKRILVAHSAPIISNQCFADDTILFTQATMQEAEVVTSILNKYAAVSWQIINMEKSTMVFSPNARPWDAASIQ